MQNFADDCSIGNDHHGLVNVQEFSRENIDSVDFAMFSKNLDELPNTKRFGDDNTQTWEKIELYPLKGQVGSNSSDAETSDQGKYLNAELLQHHQQGKEHNDAFDYPNQ